MRDNPGFGSTRAAHPRAMQLVPFGVVALFAQVSAAFQPGLEHTWAYIASSATLALLVSAVVLVPWNRMPVWSQAAGPAAPGRMGRVAVGLAAEGGDRPDAAGAVADRVGRAVSPPVGGRGCCDRGRRGARAGFGAQARSGVRDRAAGGSVGDAGRPAGGLGVRPASSPRRRDRRTRGGASSG